MSQDWSDPGLRHATTRESNWYKCILGVKDVIRILDKCHTVYRHNWEEGGKFRTQMCSKEDHGACPFCDKLAKDPTHKRQPVFGSIVLHILRGPIDGGKARIVGKVLAWRFGEDKKNDLVEINELTGKRLKEVDLQIRVNGSSQDNEKFQKLTIRNLADPVFKRLPAEVQKRLLGEIKDRRDVVNALLHPSPEDLSRYIKDEEEAESFNPDEIEADAKGGTETDLDTDAELGEGGLDTEPTGEEETAFEEDTPKPSRNAKIMKKGKQPPPKGKKRAPVEEEVEDDDFGGVDSNDLDGLIR